MSFVLYQKSTVKKRGVVRWVRPEVWSNPYAEITLSAVSAIGGVSAQDGRSG